MTVAVIPVPGRGLADGGPLGGPSRRHPATAVGTRRRGEVVLVIGELVGVAAVDRLVLFLHEPQPDTRPA